MWDRVRCHAVQASIQGRNSASANSTQLFSFRRKHLSFFFVLIFDIKKKKKKKERNNIHRNTLCLKSLNYSSVLCIKKFSPIFLFLVFPTGCVRVSFSAGDGLGGFRLPTSALSLSLRAAFARHAQRAACRAVWRAAWRAA